MHTFDLPQIRLDCGKCISHRHFVRPGVGAKTSDGGDSEFGDLSATGADGGEPYIDGESNAAGGTSYNSSGDYPGGDGSGTQGGAGGSAAQNGLDTSSAVTPGVSSSISGTAVVYGNGGGGGNACGPGSAASTPGSGGYGASKGGADSSGGLGEDGVVIVKFGGAGRGGSGSGWDYTLPVVDPVPADLPDTGSDSNGPLMVFALFTLTLGAGCLVVARRAPSR